MEYPGPVADIRDIIPEWNTLGQYLAAAYMYFVLAGVVLMTSTFCSMLLYTYLASSPNHTTTGPVRRPP
jgi:hypothetical protein